MQHYTRHGREWNTMDDYDDTVTALRSRSIRIVRVRRERTIFVAYIIIHIMVSGRENAGNDGGLEITLSRSPRKRRGRPKH